MQAQDFGAASWALAQRTRADSAASIGRLFDDGAILRPHIFRPTWHFVLPGDVGWMLELSTPQLRRRLATRWRQLDLDAETVVRAEDVLTSAVAVGPRARSELGAALAGAGIEPTGQRLPHLLLAAEIDGVLVSGPRRGTAFTWRRLDERSAGPSGLHRDDALGRLATRYFTSHGPATLADFAWWSGLSATDARTATVAAGEALVREPIDGVAHWSGRDSEVPPLGTPVAHLLPNFDEYTVAYRDRSAVIDRSRPFDASIFSFGSVLANVLLIDGVVRGTWRRVQRRDDVRLEVTLLDDLSPAESSALDRAISRLAAFLERDVSVAQAVRPGS